MKGNERFHKLNLYKRAVRLLPIFVCLLMQGQVYAQREALLPVTQEEVLKKHEGNGKNWRSIFQAFMVGGLPALFEDAILRQDVSKQHAKDETELTDSLTLTIPIETAKVKKQDIPKVAVDVTTVETMTKSDVIPTSQLTDQPAPSADGLAMKPVPLAETVTSSGAQTLQTNVVPKALTLTKPPTLGVPERREEKERRIGQNLSARWLRLFFHKKEAKISEPLPSDVERKSESLPLVITPTRMEEPLNRVGRSVTVVSAKQIKAQGSYTLTEAVRNVPGVRARTMGSLGDFSTISIRGTRPWDTAVLIEGMPLRDASDPQGSFVPFLEDVFTDHFSQIEVMRGTGSTLYGSEAIGGVINLRMKQGKEGRPRVKAEFDGGAFETIHHAYQVSGGMKGFDYYLGYSHNGSDGIRHPDAYGAHSFGVNTGYQWKDRFEARSMLNAVGSKLDVNDGPSLLNDTLIEDTADPNHVRDAQFIHYNSFIRYRLNDHIQQKTKFAFMDTHRRFVNGPDQIDRVFTYSRFDGNIANIEPEIDFTLNEYYSLVGGVEYEREEFRQLVNNRWDSFDGHRYGPFVENRFSFFQKKLNLSAGGRVSRHEEFGTHESGELSGSYLIEKTNTRFKGHFGTGFREPSLFELFGRTLSSRGVLNVFGNPNLKPEKSISWDAGLEQKFFHESITFAGTFFKNEFSRRIAFIGRQYAMREGGHSQGGEFELKWQPIKNLQLGASYTRTFSEADGRSITGLPRHLFGFNLDWEFWNRFHYHLDFTHKGREQIALFAIPSFTTKFVDQKSYTKVDMKLSFDLNDHLTMWTRADNAFDSDILEDGFRNPGAQAFGGVSMEI